MTRPRLHSERSHVTKDPTHLTKLVLRLLPITPDGYLMTMRMFPAPRMAQKCRLGAKYRCHHWISPPQKTTGSAPPLQLTNPSTRFASLSTISMVSEVNSTDTLSNSSLSPNRLWKSIYLASSNIASIQSSHESATHYTRVFNNTSSAATSFKLILDKCKQHQRIYQVGQRHYS